jgi:hypothetical protein
MKKHLRITLITLIALGLGTTQARADDEALAAIGGFIAGIITGAVIEDQNDYGRHDRVEIRVGHDRYGYRDSCHKHGHRDCRSCYKNRTHRSGHWETRYVKVWVPGHWEFVRNRCGDHVRIWKSGYYERRPKKVWVSPRGRDRHGSTCG